MPSLSKPLASAVLLGGLGAAEAFAPAGGGRSANSVALRGGHGTSAEPAASANADASPSSRAALAGGLWWCGAAGVSAAVALGGGHKKQKAATATRAPCRSMRRSRGGARGGDGLPIAVPFLGAPAYRAFAANVPGDAGFDPLGLWKDPDMGSFAGVKLDMRDAEIKHGRLAMLAAAHWPFAELLQPKLAAAFGHSSELVGDGLNLSLLNGGLVGNQTLDVFLAMALVAAAPIDLGKKKDSAPGDYDLDPLGLKDFSPPVLASFLPEGRPWMAEAEIKHGRLAMVAIAAFAAQEFVSKVPIVQETPFLFQWPL